MEDVEITEQKTCESCLAVCLMGLLRREGIEVDEGEEIKILMAGLTFTKKDYATGQLVYVCNKYGVDIESYVDYPSFHSVLTGIAAPPSLKTMQKAIEYDFMTKMMKESPAVVYMDMFYLNGEYHYSHFVVLNSLNEQYARISDPWDGRIKDMDTKYFMKAVESVNLHLGISPRLIRIL